MRIEKLRQNFDVDIRLVHFPLHPETPAEGRTLEELFAGRGVDIKASYERMKGLMDAEGLEYGQRTHTYNSRLAQEIGKWADTQPGGDAIHDAFYRAYFVDARNIGDEEVILDIVAAVGLDVDAAKKVLTERSFKDAVDADWAKSSECGVTGVPTFAAAGYGVFGAQPYEALAQLMSQAGAREKAETGAE